MKMLDGYLTKFNRWIDQRAFRMAMYLMRFEDLVASGKTPEEAVESIEKDIADGKTGWVPMTKGGGKKRR